MAVRLRVAPSELGDMPLFCTTEAEQRGISRRDLRVMVGRGLIWRVARGWYSSRMDATEEERHVLTAAAVLRLQGEASAACRHSAVLLHGLPLARTNLDVVEVAKTNTTHGRTRRGVRVSELGAARSSCTEVAVLDLEEKVRVVDPATAIVGVAMTNNPIGALVAGDHALRHDVCTREQIEAVLDRSRGGTGIARAREVLSHLEPRHESPGETLTAAVLRKGELAFDPQVEVVVDGHRYRLDFALREHRVAIEFDGMIKYTGPEVMEAQEEREARLRAAGWIVVRFTWDDLADEGEVLRRVLAAIARATAAA